MSRRLNAAVVWTVVAWLLVIVSGALTTGLLLVPPANPALVPALVIVHGLVGATAGLLAIIVALRRRPRRYWWRAAAVGLAVLWGWFAARSFGPTTAAVHAMLGALSFVAVATSPGPSSGMAATPSRVAWTVPAARAAFGLVLLQVGAGALLRHGRLGLPWHLLFGGVATIAVLVPAVAILQDGSRPAPERRAARWAVTAVLIQVSLGASVVLMLFVGFPSIWMWHAATIAHVTVGSLTLLATAILARVLGEGRSSAAAPIRAA